MAGGVPEGILQVEASDLDCTLLHSSHGNIHSKLGTSFGYALHRCMPQVRIVVLGRRSGAGVQAIHRCGWSDQFSDSPASSCLIFCLEIKFCHDTMMWFAGRQNNQLKEQGALVSTVVPFRLELSRTINHFGLVLEHPLQTSGMAKK